MEAEEPIAVQAGRYLARLAPITVFANRVLNDADGMEASGAQHTAHGLLDRVVCWLRTLAALDQAHYYQANLAAARAMIEITVDLAYLATERVNEFETACS